MGGHYKNCRWEGRGNCERGEAIVRVVGEGVVRAAGEKFVKGMSEEAKERLVLLYHQVYIIINYYNSV